MRLSFIGLISALFFISCNSVDFSEEISKMEEIESNLSAIEEDFNAIDTAKIMELMPLFEKDYQWTRDSLTRESMKHGTIYLKKLKTLKKVYENFEGDHSQLRKEIEYSKKQVKDLKEDLVGQRIEKEKGSQYVSQEEQAILSLRGQLNKLLGRISYIEDYKEVRDEFFSKI